MELQDSTLPLAHRANTDAPGHWEARVEALSAKRDALVARGWSLREAATLALMSIDGELEAQAEQERQAAQAEQERIEQERQAAARGRARAKAEYHISAGLVIRHSPDGAALVPSGTRGGVVHRVAGGRCSCEAGQSGRACWHVEAVAIAAEQTVSRAQRISSVLASLRRKAVAAD